MCDVEGRMTVNIEVKESPLQQGGCGAGGGVVQYGTIEAPRLYTHTHTQKYTHLHSSAHMNTGAIMRRPIHHLSVAPLLKRIEE